jgi:hypothetical protein
MDAARAAPHGQCMACVESTLHAEGFEHHRKMLQAVEAPHSSFTPVLIRLSDPGRLFVHSRSFHLSRGHTVSCARKRPSGTHFPVPDTPFPAEQRGFSQNTKQ